MSWQLQEAKARLSEVIRKAQVDGPQHITVRGMAAAVVVSEADYEQMAGSRETLVEFMRRSPLYGEDAIELSRNDSPVRDVEL